MSDDDIITRERVVEELRAIVAEVGPDFAYHPDEDGQCSYFPNEEYVTSDGIQRDANPLGCIVGYVYERLGGHRDDLHESVSPTGMPPGIWGNYEDSAVRLLGDVQQGQDQGWTWDASVRSALIDPDDDWDED